MGLGDPTVTVWPNVPKPLVMLSKLLDYLSDWKVNITALQTTLRLADLNGEEIIAESINRLQQQVDQVTETETAFEKALEDAQNDYHIVLPAKIASARQAVDALMDEYRRIDTAHANWTVTNAKFRVVLSRDYDDAMAILQQVTEVLQKVNSTGLIEQSRLFSTISDRNGFEAGQSIDLATCDPRATAGDLVRQLLLHMDHRVRSQASYEANMTAAVADYQSGVRDLIVAHQKMSSYYESELKGSQDLATLAQDQLLSIRKMRSELISRIASLKGFSADMSAVFALRDTSLSQVIQTRDGAVSVMKLFQTKVAVEYQ